MHFTDSARVSNLFQRRPELADELREIVAIGEIRGANLDRGVRSRLMSFLDKKRPTLTRTAARNGRAEAALASELAKIESIVLMIGRPPLLVQRGTYLVPESTTGTVPNETLDQIKNFDKSKIDAVIQRTGRVDLIGIPNVPFVGTAWIIDKTAEERAVLVTNRHVAKEFARAAGHGRYHFKVAPNFRDYRAEIDFLREYDSDKRANVPVVDVLFIAPEGAPDIALLEIVGSHVKKLQPIEISAKQVGPDTPIGVVGYPAYDSRNDHAAIVRYFGDIFNVKRFAFGEADPSPGFPDEFTHDATTLGGNSGSCVFNLESGKAVGLHFAGDFSVANYAVSGKAILDALAGLSSTVVVSSSNTEIVSDGRKPVSFYRDRDGFNREFLGRGKKRIELPGPGERWEKDLADVKDADSRKITTELKYRHFSVVMSVSRKLPLITAVNIDGLKSKRLGRVDKWYVDGRLHDTFQIGNEAYARNPLDRGHMVRREDPVWGSMEDANQANIDTFHYTNCAPQHAGLNQKEWLALENYVLGNARTHKLKVSVLTGPILRQNDPVYERSHPESISVQLPEDFWKVVVIVDGKTKRLSATGYVLTQGNMIRRLTEVFVYGGFRTYQVPISVIGDETGLDFGFYIPFDPMARVDISEGVNRESTGLFRAIETGTDMMLFKS